MTKASKLSKAVSVLCLAGTSLFAACGEEPSRESPGDTAAREAVDADGADPTGGTTSPQRSTGPSTCFVRPNDTCDFSVLGSPDCQTSFACSWGCEGLPPLCDFLTIDMSDGSIDGDVDCALSALRDGKEGVLQWRWHFFIFEYTQTISIISGRRAMREAVYYQDLVTSAGKDGPAPLRDAAYFDNCLANAADAETLKTCLLDAAVGCGVIFLKRRPGAASSS